MPFFNDNHLANDMIPQMLENCVGKIDITIGLNEDCAIIEM